MKKLKRKWKNLIKLSKSLTIKQESLMNNNDFINCYFYNDFFNIMSILMNVDFIML